MNAENEATRPGIDATTFQRPLGELANTIALKVDREGRKQYPKPKFLMEDIYVLMCQALHTYDLFFFLNADDRRKNDADWKVAYSIVTLPLIRCMIDCFYNITAMLADPAKGFQFRESGYKEALAALDANEKRYGGDPSWDVYIASRRKRLSLLLRRDGLTAEQVKNAKLWPTLSGYLRVKKNVPLTPHQDLLKKLTYGMWQEYSGMAHGTFQGLMPNAVFYLRKPPDFDRELFKEMTETAISMHITRVAAILLCIVSEVQASFQFEGARISQRLNQVWSALIPLPEIRELYDDRYAQLIKDRKIHR
jgi:hypothetical protein